MEMTLDNLVVYEIAGSWWASYCPFTSWAGRYFVRKAKRKLKRATKFYEQQAALKHAEAFAQK